MAEAGQLLRIEAHTAHQPEPEQGGQGSGLLVGGLNLEGYRRRPGWYACRASTECMF